MSTVLGAPLGLGGAFLGDKIADGLEKIGVIDIKCEPVTPTPWIYGNESNIIEGAPALMTGSKLACRYGGIISIVEEKSS